jgi:hypothetical protein
MPITVNVGELLECDQNDEIRTRGCDPCVGLVVIYNHGGGGNLVKRCAHFSVNFAGPYNQHIINTALDPVLNNYFPVVNIVAVGFTWGGGGAGMGSVQICNRLRAYFAGNAPIESAVSDSITTNANAIQIVNNQHWAFTHNPNHNLEAEL